MIGRTSGSGAPDGPNATVRFLACGCPVVRRLSGRSGSGTSHPSAAGERMFVLIDQKVRRLMSESMGDDPCHSDAKIGSGSHT